LVWYSIRCTAADHQLILYRDGTIVKHPSSDLTANHPVHDYEVILCAPPGIKEGMAKDFTPKVFPDRPRANQQLKIAESH
jgi:hypothetical protein